MANRPNFTIYSDSMLHAQAIKLTPAQKVQIHAWADTVADARYARGETDADGPVRPTQFSVPVRDSIGALIGHMVYPT